MEEEKQKDIEDWIKKLKDKGEDEFLAGLTINY